MVLLNMLIAVTCTERDLLNALDLHHGRSWPENLLRVPGLVVFGLWCLLGFALFLRGAQPWIFQFGCLLLVLWTLNLAWAYLIQPFRVSRFFHQQRGFREVVRYEVDATGVAILTERGVSRLTWGQIVRWKCSRSTLLLYHSSQVFNFIPARALKDQDRDDLFALLKSQHVLEERPRYAQLQPWVQALLPVLFSVAAWLALYNAWRTAQPQPGHLGSSSSVMWSAATKDPIGTIQTSGSGSHVD